MFRSYEFKRYDYISIIIVTLLFIISYYAIGSATRINLIEGDSSYATKQLYGFIIGFIMMIIVSFIDYHLIGKFVIPIYILNVGLLVAVLIIGREANGAVRWIQIFGSYSIQPSEFSKLFMIIVLAKYFDKFESKINKLYILIGAAILMIVPVLLIERQPDLSSSLVLVFLLIIMYFGSGVSYKYIIIVVAIGIPLIIGLLLYIQTPEQVLLENYQKDRILAMINPEEYEMSAALQTQKSVQAIGSGQLSGKGLYQGKLNQYNYIPEPQTDFIFSIIGEEFGFIGCSVVLVLLALLMIRVLYIGKDSQDLMGQLIVVGFVGIIAFHTFINVGVTTAIVPNTGLPLPFVSAGLSALWSNMLMLGVILNLSIQRKLSL